MPLKEQFLHVPICVYKYMPICVYKYMPICVYKYVPICVYKYVPICVYKYLRKLFIVNKIGSTLFYQQFSFLKVTELD